MNLFLRKPPWYVAGLAFECAECGRCCAGPEEGYVWLSEREIAAVAEHLGVPDEQVRREYVRRVGRRFSLIERKENHDCVFLCPSENGRRGCRIYEVRPAQCRTWPFWPSNVRSPDDWAMAGAKCPGINRGTERFDSDEIQRRARATGD